MEKLVARLGLLNHEARRRGRPSSAYGSLVRSIVGQQLSTGAARTIYERLLGLFDGRVPLPLEILRADEAQLRGAGLSGRKVEYLRDLARHVEDGLDLDALSHLPDEDVANRLTTVRGIGRWSADMFLIFHLQRPDVLPVGDLGIRRAAGLAYGLPEAPVPEALWDLAEPWRPYRSLACLYLWESLDGPQLVR